MKYFKRFYFILLLSMVFFSCTEILEPTLLQVIEVEVLTATKSKLEINAKMVLNNPNSFALDLDKAAFKALVDGIEIASFSQSYESKMPANFEFKMPINVNMDLDKLYNDNPIAALGKGIQLLTSRKVTVHFIGSIKVGKGMAKVTVPIDRIEEVKF